MRKNTTNQVVAFQMNSTTDGSAVTSGTPMVYYTVDGGTQGTGTGTATHEGNGQWSYVPAQAETNGDHVAFTMVLSGAISQTVNVYPVAGGDNPHLLQSTTIATLASQTSFTLTAGSSDDGAYAGATVVVTDASTSTQKAVGVVADYTGSTKTITLTADPGVFTMAAGDSIAIIAGSFVASAGGTVGWLG